MKAGNDGWYTSMTLEAEAEVRESVDTLGYIVKLMYK